MMFDRIRQQNLDGAVWYALKDVACWLKISPDQAVRLAKEGGVAVRVERDMETHECRRRKALITAEGIALITAEGIALITAMLYALPISEAPDVTACTKEAIRYRIKTARYVPRFRAELKQWMDAAPLTEQERHIIELRAFKGMSSRRAGFEANYCQRHIERIQGRAIGKIVKAHAMGEEDQI